MHFRRPVALAAVVVALWHSAASAIIEETDSNTLPELTEENIQSISAIDNRFLEQWLAGYDEWTASGVFKKKLEKPVKSDADSLPSHFCLRNVDSSSSKTDIDADAEDSNEAEVGDELAEPPSSHPVSDNPAVLPHGAAQSTYSNKVRKYYNDKIDGFLDNLGASTKEKALTRLSYIQYFANLDIPVSISDTFEEQFGFDLMNKRAPLLDSPLHPLYQLLNDNGRSRIFLESLSANIGKEVYAMHLDIIPRLINATIQGLRQQLHRPMSDNTLLVEVDSVRNQIGSCGAPLKKFFFRSPRQQNFDNFARQCSFQLEEPEEEEASASQEVPTDLVSALSNRRQGPSTSSRSSVRFVGEPVRKPGGLLSYARWYYKRTCQKISDYFQGALESLIDQGMSNANANMQLERVRALRKLRTRLCKVISSAIDEMLPELARAGKRKIDGSESSGTALDCKSLPERSDTLSTARSKDCYSNSFEMLYPEIDTLLFTWTKNLLEEIMTFAKIDLNKELSNVHGMATSEARRELSGWVPSMFYVFSGSSGV